MGTLIRQVESFLNSDSRPFTILNDESLTFRFDGLEGDWVCYAAASDTRNEFVFFSIFQDTTPKPMRAAMLDFINRANYGLVVGNFEMNPDDGEVRFRTGVDTTDAPLTPTVIQHLIYSNWVTMDRYFKGMLSIMSGRLTPPEAIALSEENDPD